MSRTQIEYENGVRIGFTTILSLAPSIERVQGYVRIVISVVVGYFAVYERRYLKNLVFALEFYFGYYKSFVFGIEHIYLPLFTFVYQLETHFVDYRFHTHIVEHILGVGQRYLVFELAMSEARRCCFKGQISFFVFYTHTHDAVIFGTDISLFYTVGYAVFDKIKISN